MCHPLELSQDESSPPDRVAYLARMEQGQTWEMVAQPNARESVQRMQVEGGWLYRNVLMEELENQYGVWHTRIAMCFVPGEDHVH
jgi:hypothetical protein